MQLSTKFLILVCIGLLAAFIAERMGQPLPRLLLNTLVVLLFLVVGFRFFQRHRRPPIE